ncbi:unnamed protein product [Vitrella brassicaformis CCMP3155]|uniref:RRM domain-containing protein n=1 Tax=Vitrella brassicaformis (strain CCMP3155) TaxID=1169540 RepID=A0A0G4ENK0_VITBC|nr:unnamed protein product [Vitrella brassicaformis CCMP3155]|eukprot:CEL98554.1 unnamed protein product [Vitrella brassicaformis CCMP3155]
MDDASRDLSVRHFPSGIIARASDDTVPMLERQEGLLIEYLPPESCTAEAIVRACREEGLPVDANDVLIMRSRLGRPTGRAMVACEEPLGGTASEDFLRHLPRGTRVKIMDKYDVQAFVEQCERYVRLSEDLRFLARPENFRRTVTITELPTSYGRLDLAYFIKKHANVDLAPQDIVFRFKRHGQQSDMAWVVCPTERAANQVIHHIQETAVPKRVQYGTLFGCSFIWARRSSVFLSHPNLDFVPSRSKYQIVTTGWHHDMSEEDFTAMMNEISFYPQRVTGHSIGEHRIGMFFMEFPRMHEVKKAFGRLRHIKKRWGITESEVFFAYPKTADVHWADEEKYADEDSACDTDIDEPVDY